MHFHLCLPGVCHFPPPGCRYIIHTVALRERTAPFIAHECGFLQVNSKSPWRHQVAYNQRLEETFTSWCETSAPNLTVIISTLAMENWSTPLLWKILQAASRCWQLGCNKVKGYLIARRCAIENKQNERCTIKYEHMYDTKVKPSISMALGHFQSIAEVPLSEMPNPQMQSWQEKKGHFTLPATSSANAKLLHIHSLIIHK